MSRIDFRGLLDYLKASNHHTRATINGSSVSVINMKTLGKELYDEAVRIDKSHGKKNIGVSDYSLAEPSAQYVLSKEATNGMKRVNGAKAPGTFEFDFPQFNLAKAFAMKKGDKKLIKIIERIEKYSREEYKYTFQAKEVALSSYLIGEKRADVIRKKEEDLHFLRKHSSLTFSELLKEKEKIKDRINSYSRSSYSSSSYAQIEKLERNLKLIESLMSLNRKKRKKIVVGKTKEIQEIREKALKNKGYKNKYIKLLRKSALAHRMSMHMTGDLDLIHKAQDIIYEMGKTIVYNYTDEHGRDLMAPEISIDEKMREKIEQQLTEKFYSTNNRKTR